MAGQRCERCGRVEEIPTHQFVKFDLEVRYLCEECWDTFRSWFIRGKAQEGAARNRVFAA